MRKPWYPSASYNLWSQFAPPIGQEYRHCSMKRGFNKARKKEPLIAPLVTQDSIPQRIGILAQRGVYEFHQNLVLLSQRNGVEEVTKILELNQEIEEVQERVVCILNRYYEQPVLVGKQNLNINRGDEGVPEPILIQQGDYWFDLYAAIDCYFTEPNGTIHILDLKTGKSDFDKRQAYVYLLAAQYLYPQQKAVASFYNLETGEWSNPLSATVEAIESIQIELAQISKQHKADLQRYRQNPQQFDEVFPPNPGFACQYCPFKSICNYSAEVCP